MLIAKNKAISSLFLLFSVLYIAQVALVAPEQSVLTRYNISSTKAIVLALSVAIPYVLIWLVALVGYLRLKEYTDIIKSSKDGQAFKIISLGILWLGLWLPISTIANNLATHAYDIHPSRTAILVRLINYLNILILFPAFVTIYLGSKRLLRLVRLKQQTVAPPVIPTLFFLAFSALYVMLVIQDPGRNAVHASAITTAYYEPNWLIVITIIIPRLIMWFLGIQAAVNVFRYGQLVNGTIYRHALKNLARGIGGVVIATIALRCVQSLSSPINNLNLAVLIILIYALLLAIGVGFYLISNGARSLTRLEKI